MFTGASAPGGGDLAAMAAIAEAVKDPNFSKNIATLQAREKAANDAEVSAQTRIDTANAMAVQLDKREHDVAGRESASDVTDRRHAKAKAYLDSRDADLTKREAELAAGVKALADHANALQAAQAKAESDANTRIANAQAALNKRAAAVTVTEQAAAKALADANAAKADYEARVARLKQAVA